MSISSSLSSSISWSRGVSSLYEIWNQCASDKEMKVMVKVAGGEAVKSKGMRY